MSASLTCPRCGQTARPTLLEPVAARACPHCSAKLFESRHRPPERRPASVPRVRSASIWEPWPEPPQRNVVLPPELPPESDARHARLWRMMSGSWVASAMVHAVALITLAIVVTKARHQPPALPLMASIAEPVEMMPLENLPEAQVSQHDSGRVGQLAVVGQVRAEFDVDVSLNEFGSAGQNDFGLGIAAGGIEQYAHVDEPGPTTFFGVPAQGDQFVFVVDISGSMTRDGRFERAINELRRSLQSLKPYQRYFVIFFNTYSFPMEGGELLLASDANRKETFEWISRALPGGTTFPRESIDLALALEPDAIYLLSDGNFQPWESNALLRKRPERGPKAPTGSAQDEYIPIHTIAFVSREGEVVMEAMAKVTGGTYRFVP